MSQPHIVNNADERSNMGFPVIPFALLWPILKVIIVPVLQQILPELLELLAAKIRSGQAATFTAQELDSCVDRYQSTAKNAYRG
jgi:hypothetical protein